MLTNSSLFYSLRQLCKRQSTSSALVVRILLTLITTLSLPFSSFSAAKTEFILIVRQNKSHIEAKYTLLKSQ